MTDKPLKILHLGNVANYAYNVAKVMQNQKIKSDALSWDYYHINARPEWEEADFDSSNIGDQYFPLFPKDAYISFNTPAWYSHGQMKLAALYLIARNERKHVRAWLIRKVNERHLRRIADRDWRERQVWLPTSRIAEGLCLDLMGEGRTNTLRGAAAVLRGLRKGRPTPVTAQADEKVQTSAQTTRTTEFPDFTDDESGRSAPSQRVSHTSTRTKVLERIRAVIPNINPNDPFDSFVIDQIFAYTRAYPTRTFNPLLLLQFRGLLKLLNRLFKDYDLVVGYAIEGIWPLVAGKPYVAYEFGTIRNIPFADDDQGRLGFLAYRNAARTIVTNCDVQRAADALKLNYFFLPHIINEGGLPTADDVKKMRGYLHDTQGGDFIVFHPPRQHWGPERNTNWDKGNDHFFRGFAEFARTAAPGARCIAVEWGESLNDSKRLVESLGIAGQVTWIKPQPHASMMRYIAACDVVADQFTITTFGGIPPKAFYAGKPVISAFDPELHRWCFDEMPPIADCRNAETVAGTLTRLYRDLPYRAELGATGRTWYDIFNSNDRIREILTAQIVEVIMGFRRKIHDPRGWMTWQSGARPSAD